MWLYNIIFHFFKVLGLATVKLNTSTAHKKNVQIFFSHSRIDVIYNTFLVLLSFTLNYFSSEKMHKLYKLANMTSYEIIIDKIRLVLANTCVLVSLVTFCFRQREATEILNNIVNIKKTLKVFNQEIFKKSLCIHSKMLQLGIASTFTWCLSNISILFYTNELAICFIAKYIVDLINYYVIIEYALVLLLIGQLFKTINDNIHQTFYVNKLPNHQFIHQNEMTPKNIEDIRDRFSELHELHLSVYKISTNVSDFYALPMLFCLSHAFISLLSYSYYFVRPIVFGLQTLTTLLYVHSFFRLIHLSVLFLILTKCATAVIVEVRKFISIYF